MHTMAWRMYGEKLLSRPMFTQLNDAYMGHYGEMG